MSDRQPDYYENEPDYYTSVDHKPALSTEVHHSSSAHSSAGVSAAVVPSLKCGLTLTTVLLSVTMVVSLAALVLGIAALATGAGESGEVERRLTECRVEVEVSCCWDTLAPASLHWCIAGAEGHGGETGCCTQCESLATACGVLTLLLTQWGGSGWAGGSPYKELLRKT